MSTPAQRVLKNPHLDDDRVVWSDDFSGLYQPTQYDQQFDEQWKLFLEGRLGFVQHTGVETSDPYIDDRVFELTGVLGVLTRKRFGFLAPLVMWIRDRGRQAERRGIGGRLSLEPKFPIDFFRGKRCLDIGCGAGRWTRTLMTLGASVKSVDVSEHALRSTRRFNADVEYLNLFDIEGARPDLHETFDFTLCWGVIMCTHDPKLAFQNVAKTVEPGGLLYTMIYSPTYHNSSFVLEHRRKYHTQLRTMEEKLQYAYEIADRPENAINLLDMLNTFYNWTVPEEVINKWYESNGFENVTTLNANEAIKCAYHVLGSKRKSGMASFAPRVDTDRSRNGEA